MHNRAKHLVRGGGGGSTHQNISPIGHTLIFSLTIQRLFGLKGNQYCTIKAPYNQHLDSSSTQPVNLPIE